MLSFSELKYDDATFARYRGLFARCFPNAHHLSERYLRWLYVDNPSGRAIGMDAQVDGQLVAHYSCVPARVVMYGREVDALLSLNTATHPDFQGRGFFTKLAELTYAKATSLGFACVFGVANANSTPGFTRKLGFQLVSPLDARLGFGCQLEIDWRRAIDVAEFRRVWDAHHLAWRARNPANPLRICHTSRAGVLDAYGRTDRKGIVVWGQIPLADASGPGAAAPTSLAPRLFLGLVPTGCARRKLSVRIPARFRPSPLNFIARALTVDQMPHSGCVSFSFIDFDAY